MKNKNRGGSLIQEGSSSTKINMTKISAMREKRAKHVENKKDLIGRIFGKKKTDAPMIKE